MKYTNKTVTIRQHFDKVDKETVTDVGSYLRPTLNHLSEISLSTLEHVVVQIRSTTCPSNCIPTWFLKEVFQSVGPDILTIINRSLSAGIFPSFFKHATVYPLLKKPSLDPCVLENFRPISKLPFLSKILEKIVLHN